MQNADEGEILYIYANMQNIMDELTSRIYICEKKRETYTQKKLKPRNENYHSEQIEC